MSAPDTNIEKQEKNHKPSLLGVKGAMIFGILAIGILAFVVVDKGRDTAADDVQTSGQVETEATAAPVDPVATGTNESN